MRRLAGAIIAAIVLSALGVAQDQRPVIRGAIDRVRVDVIVTDQERDHAAGAAGDLLTGRRRRPSTSGGRRHLSYRER